MKAAEEMFDATVQAQTWVTDGTKWKVPAGLECSICPASDPDRRWRPYTTRTIVYGKRVSGSSGAIVLLIDVKKNPAAKRSEMQQWLILTKEKEVRRDDGGEQPSGE